MPDTLSADERPETYRAAAAIMRERPGSWTRAYDPPGGLPSDPSTKLCLVAAIQEAAKSKPRTPYDGYYGRGAAALAAFEAASGQRPFRFYRDHGALAAAGILDTIAARLESA